MRIGELDDVIARARAIKMSAEDLKAQRESFAYGNVALEDSRVTREIVRDAARTIELRGSRG